MKCIKVGKTDKPTTLVPGNENIWDQPYIISIAGATVHLFIKSRKEKYFYFEHKGQWWKGCVEPDAVLGHRGDITLDGLMRGGHGAKFSINERES